MKVKIITSGSKANCTLVVCNNTKILIDVGATTQYIVEELKKVDITPDELDAILITHTHSDHIRGLKTFIKKTKADVYITEELAPVIIKNVPATKIKLVEDSFKVNDVILKFFKLSHDVPCNGIYINDGNKELVYITDTGYVNKKYYGFLKNKDIYIMESNYNEKMLLNGPYPFILKQRILSDSGHMSNKYSGNLLTKLVGVNTKVVFLAHISENNNTYDLAKEEVVEELQKIDFDINKIIVTHQLQSLEMIEI